MASLSSFSPIDPLAGPASVSSSNMAVSKQPPRTRSSNTASVASAPMSTASGVSLSMPPPNGTEMFWPIDPDNADGRNKAGSIHSGSSAPAAGIMNARVQRLLDGDLSPDEESPQNSANGSPASARPSPPRQARPGPGRLGSKSGTSARSAGPESPAADERGGKMTIRMHTLAGPVPTMADLSSIQRHALQLRARHRAARARLERRQVAVALGSRLCDHAAVSYRRLVHFMGREDKSAFAGLSAGLRAMRDSWAVVAVASRDVDPSFVTASKSRSWLSELSESTQAEIIGLVNSIRTDAGFLSGCISGLSNSELLTLVTARLDGGLPANGPANGGSATSQALNNALKGGKSKAGSTGSDVLAGEKGAAAVLDRLVGLGRTEGCFAAMSNVFGAGEAENRAKLATWAEVCARLLVGGREGWYTVVWACFDAWVGVDLEHSAGSNSVGVGRLGRLGRVFGPGYAQGSGWAARRAVEVWLMGVLEQGRFVVDDRLGPAGQGQVDRFFDSAITDLFDIVARDGGVPNGVLDFGSALLKALSGLTSSEHKRGEALYQISDWFLRIFLPGIIATPERVGMLLGVCINKKDRVLILRELVGRLQRRIIVGKVVPEVRKRVEAMVRRSGIVKEPATASSLSTGPKPYIVLCPADVLTLVNVLFPDRKTGQISPKPGPGISFSAPPARVGSDMIDSPLGSGSAVPTPPISVGGRGSRSRHIPSSAASVSSVGSAGSGSTAGGPAAALSSSAMSGSGISLMGSGPGSALGLGSSLGGGLGSAGFRARPASALVSVAREEAAGVFARPFERADRADRSRDRARPETDGVSLGREAVTGVTRNPFFQLDGAPGRAISKSGASASASAAADNTTGLDSYAARMRALAVLLADRIDELPSACRPFVGPSEKRTVTGLCHPCAEMWTVLRIEDGAVLIDEPEEDDGLAELEEDDDDQEDQDDDCTNEDSAVSTAESDPGANRVEKAAAGLGEFDYHFVRTILLELSRSGFLSSTGRRSVIGTVEHAYRTCVRREEWMAAHRLHQALGQLRRISASSLGRDDFGPLLRMVFRGIREAVDDLEASSRDMDGADSWASQAERAVANRLDETGRVIGRLRGKLWYMADVQGSAVYEDARTVAAALRAMGDADPDNDAAADGFGSAVSSDRVGADEKSGSSDGQGREHGFLVQTDGQALGLLAAGPGLGGPRKLADKQAELTLDWLKRNRVECFCRAEERVFRLSLELSKAVGSLVGEGMMDGPVLWSSELFERDRRRWWGPAGPASPEPGPAPPSAGTNTPVGPHTGPHGIFGFRFKQADVDFVTEPAEVGVTVVPVEAIAEWTAGQAKVDGPGPVSDEKAVLLTGLRRQLTGLLLSDIGAGMFWDGSELDRWLRSGRVRQLQKTDSSSADPGPRPTLTRRLADSSPITPADAPADFPFDTAFKRILARFAHDPDPGEKLAALLLLEQVVLAYLTTPPAGRPTGSAQVEGRPSQGSSAGSMPSAELIVEMLQAIFRDPGVSPNTLFRDLQYVALFVPADTLDMGERGKAYWDVSLAALGMKQDALRAVVNWSVRAITNWARQHGVGESSSMTESIGPVDVDRPTAEPVSDELLEKAVSLLVRAAREGHPAAMRELATIYLTVPGIVPPVVAGLARAGQIVGPHVRVGRDRDDRPKRPSEQVGTKVGPIHLAIARYWMEKSRKAGDELAVNYLRGKGDSYTD